MISHKHAPKLRGFPLSGEQFFFLEMCPKEGESPLNKTSAHKLRIETLELWVKKHLWGAITKLSCCCYKWSYPEFYIPEL